MLGSRLSRQVRGVEIVDADLGCLRNVGLEVNGTVLNAYASLTSDQESLTQAGCVILSSLVPHWIRGSSCGINLESYVTSGTSKSQMLAARVWAFPLCGGEPAHWILGWVDWSAHEMGFFDSLDTYLPWAKEDLRDAAAGLEHWLKYQTDPDVGKLRSRFKGWKQTYHCPPLRQTQQDHWSCGLFVMMAMSGLADLDFSHVRRDRKHQMRLSALQLIENVP
ncbi:hypothetical protein M405DRAFT_869302 [Rhizopogon salebrosus TDB-379]|nr:hypothetical protein M405DRAFT_869302 [Rhizopogon salebrosus TDB-379]